MKFILLGEKEDIEKSLTMFLSQYTKLEDLEFVLKSIREFPGSLLKLSQEYFDSLDRQIQLVIMRKVIDEIGMENVRFVHAYNYFKKTLTTEPLTFYSLVSAYLTTGGEIFITHPFKIKLYWNEKLARLFGCDCAERVINIYKKHQPFLNNNRLELEYVLDTSRKYAFGETTKDELDLAQRSIQYIIQDIGSVHLKEDTGLCSILHSILSNTALHIFNKRPVLAWNTWRQDNAWEIAQNSAPSTPKLFDEFVWQFKRIFEYFLGERTVETERKKYLDNSIP